uniref:LRR receptor-like serine/threonine-protein kinase GSO1 n=1 Tax=Rhizophora mucronata TaxID=61149 RepID=A0A2P2J1Q5_RHIMU
MIAVGIMEIFPSQNWEN